MADELRDFSEGESRIENPLPPERERADGADGADAELTPTKSVGGGVQVSEANPKKEGKNKDTQATLLMKLAGGCSLFHSPDGKGYISIPVAKHIETYEVMSSEARKWLRAEFHRVHRKPAADTAIETALKTLDAEAIYQRPEIPVHLRVAEQDGVIYLDLANDEWQVMKITPSGWQVKNQAPVRFRRPKGMAKLPFPQIGGSLEDELRPFLNITDPDSWKLLAGWLVGALKPRGPYPLLEVHGPQGAAKSTACKVIRALVDPNITPLRSKPRSEQDLFIQANNGWVCGFDNLSGIPEDLSDSLCRISTGGGFSTRKLYADSEETIIDAMRPVIINGIGDLVTRGDLLDRTITISINAISDEDRRDEESFWREFEKARPAILGALLDAVSCAMRNKEAVNLPKKPRMADFAIWVTAAEPAFGWRSGTFLDAYMANREGVHVRVLEADPIATLILEHVQDKNGSWKGTASDLRQQLGEKADAHRVKVPESASALSTRLKRLEPTLLHFGVRLRTYREQHAGTRIIELERLQFGVSSVSSVSTTESAGEREVQQHE